jgi:hypothetical protein
MASNTNASCGTAKVATGSRQSRGHVAASPGRGGQAKVPVAPSGDTGHVAAPPTGSGSGHVAAIPRGATAKHVAVGLRSSMPASDIIIPTGVSTDAGNILILGSDSKPYLSCPTVNDCFTGPIVGRTFTF